MRLLGPKNRFLGPENQFVGAQASLLGVQELVPGHQLRCAAVSEHLKKSSFGHELGLDGSPRAPDRCKRIVRPPGSLLSTSRPQITLFSDQKSRKDPEIQISGFREEFFPIIPYWPGVGLALFCCLGSPLESLMEFWCPGGSQELLGK